MAKIAILFRGPTRPDYRTAVDNIKLLTDCFHEHVVTVYLWTWDSVETKKLINVCNFSRAKIVTEPPLQYYADKLTEIGVDWQNNLRKWVINAYKQFWTLKNALSLVDDEYDFIVQSRLDAKIKIKNLAEWLDRNYYVTIHAYPHAPGYTNDQFGIATYEMMTRSWDYRDDATLGEFINNAGFPEIVLEQVMRMNNVSTKVAPVEIYHLEENRHQAIFEK